MLFKKKSGYVDDLSQLSSDTDVAENVRIVDSVITCSAIGDSSRVSHSTVDNSIISGNARLIGANVSGSKVDGNAEVYGVVINNYINGKSFIPNCCVVAEHPCINICIDDIWLTFTDEHIVFSKQPIPIKLLDVVDAETLSGIIGSKVTNRMHAIIIAILGTRCN